MGLLNLTEMIRILKKYFLQIVALSLAAGLIGGYAVTAVQTYTCTLGFKYNHEGALEGLALDGESKLDPYEIQNPVVIKAALENMGMQDGKDSELNVKGIRQNISINKVVTELDKEVSESAALLGEKYDVAATEYEMKFTYKASLGDEFGPKMFSNIIKEYDEFLLAKYYHKKPIEDFAKIVDGSDADYIVIADSMSTSLDNIINYLEELAGYYPDYRSQTTGYTFTDLSEIYQNLREIQYAKYYGNIRAGNLAKDKEMVIKSYQTKVKDLEEDWELNHKISQKYKTEITTFYDSYKLAGLYRQAEQVQKNVDTTNNRDQDVLEDSDLEDYTNTYDDIILNFVEKAVNSTDASHSIDYYNMIINSYINDSVSEQVKTDLITKNEKIMEEIKLLSKNYSDIANKTINELYAGKVNTDLEYLILPEASPDKPVMLIGIFLIILTFGMAVIAVFAIEIIKKFVDIDALRAHTQNDTQEKIKIDTADMDELHQLLYQQYLDDFSEFFLVYQPMVSDDADSKEHKEVFIRWQSPQFGMVSPGKIISCVSDFGIFKQLNEWIISTVCKDIAAIKASNKPLPVVHINCPYNQINDFALVDIIIKHLSENSIPASNLCLELDGKDISSALEDIMLLEELGIRICIDKFENSNEDREILNVIRPGYIKMSLDILNSDMYATSDDDLLEASENMIKYFSDVIQKCHASGIKACICGIEKSTQDDIASKMGFDYKQGYYYAKPEKLKY